MSLYLGVDVGATWTRVLLVDSGGQVVRREKLRTSASPLEDVARLVEGWRFEAVGVGSIGPMDLRSGWVINAPNAPSRRFPLVEPLRRLGRPVVVANDCVAAVWGEYVYRHHVDNLVYVTLSTGFGVGAVVNGVLLLGKDGNAHELGHAVVDFASGLRCGCGGLGHLEAIVGGANMPRAYSGLTGDAPLGPPEIFARYRQGDPRARAFMERWLDALAAGIATVSAAYDPELLLVGGSIALNNWDVIWRGLQGRLHRYMGVRPPRVELASFGDDEVAVGAAALAMKVPDSLRAFGYPR